MKTFIHYSDMGYFDNIPMKKKNKKITFPKKMLKKT